MGRKRKQLDLEDSIAKANGSAKPGHNSTLTDDERRALTLHHKLKYEAADALVEKAKSDRKAVTDLAKSELGKGVLADIKDMIAFADEQKAKGNIERALRLARWLGMPVGTSVDLFDAAVDDRAAQAGMTAGMAGGACTVPAHFSGEAHQRFIESWHAGQAVLMSAFTKKRVDVPSETGNGADVGDPPFIPPQGEPIPAAPAMPG